MKDLEKIKSEDLGCQVADANPGNFAIEQEVAQLVGATVPAPTQPSADDARELGAQLLVFLRRALLPIRSALRTAVAAIYAHLDRRCTDYTPAAYAPYQPLPPYDPMRPFVHRTLPNLLTALTAFSARKISNGSAPNDGIKDGISLAHLLLSANSVTKIEDDNPAWTCNKSPRDFINNYFPNLQKIKLNLTNSWPPLLNAAGITEIELPYLESISGGSSTNWLTNAAITELTLPSLKTIDWYNGSNSVCIYNLPNCKKLDFPNFVNVTRIGNCSLIDNLPALEEINWPKFEGYGPTGYGGWPSLITNCTALKKVVFGTIKYTLSFNVQLFAGAENLTYLEFGEGTAANILLNNWNPTDKGTTFLQNFRDHIALRLTANGTGLTLTLSQAVFDTIWNADGTPKSTDPDSVIYQINKIIKTDKHWSVNRA